MTSTPAHHQDLTLQGSISVVLRHPNGATRGVVVRVDIGLDGPLTIAVLSDQWPAGICQGALVAVRGYVMQESVEGLRRATHYVRARHVSLVRGPRPATA